MSIISIPLFLNYFFLSKSQGYNYQSDPRLWSQDSCVDSNWGEDEEWVWKFDQIDGWVFKGMEELFDESKDRRERGVSEKWGGYDPN